MANAAMGKNPSTLPSSLSNVDGSVTCGDAEAAARMNTFYNSKVDQLREALDGVEPLPPAKDWPPRPLPFDFTYTSAVGVAKARFYQQ
jgi:hypothetical protein